jgi:hypothetical protein
MEHERPNDLTRVECPNQTDTHSELAADQPKASPKSSKKGSCAKLTRSVIVTVEQLESRASLRELKEELTKTLRNAEGTVGRLKRHIAAIETLLMKTE